jgi:mannose-1-phosphate guanylyltransferase
MARAMVLAAGFGTRLRPLTDELPKPLVPVGDRPLVAHIAERLRRSGVSELVMNTHHRASDFSRWIAGLGLNVHLVHEPEIRGTAGGIRGARTVLGEGPVVVWNGDILARPPLAELLERAGAGLAFAIASRPRGAGTVGIGADGAIVRLRGEQFAPELEGGDYIGVVALGAGVLAALPEQGCLIADVALPALRRGERIATSRIAGSWTDVGSLGAYLAANLSWLDEEPGRDAWAHPTARIGAEVRVSRSLVGEGARVEGSGAIERVIVWPGAVAVAPLAGAVVTGSGRVVPIP